MLGMYGRTLDMGVELLFESLVLVVDEGGDPFADDAFIYFE